MRFADSALIAEAQARNVTVGNRIQGKARSHRRGQGTGFILRTGFVVTCDHVLDMDAIVVANRKPGRVVYKHPDYDLALIAVETRDMPMLQFETGYEVGDEAFWCGNAHGRLVDFCCPCHIGKVTESDIFVAAFAIPGSSGSLLWHSCKGKPIGVVYERDGQICKCVSAARINNFIKMAFRKLPVVDAPTLPFERTA